MLDLRLLDRFNCSYLLDSYLLYEDDPAGFLNVGIANDCSMAQCQSSIIYNNVRVLLMQKKNVPILYKNKKNMQISGLQKFQTQLAEHWLLVMLHCCSHN